MYSEKPKLHARQKAHRNGNLRIIALDVTPICGMKCSHCYAETFAHTKAVELDVLKKALDEFYELGVSHYVLQGGEPIDDPKRLEAILGMIYPDETYINVVTNGWSMTPEKIRWLKSLKVDKITFSMDSGIEEEHDRNRRPGSYKRVKAGVDNVLAEGLLTSISTVVTHQSLRTDSFKLAYDFALGKGIRIDVQIAEPVGKWDGKRDCLMTSEDSAYIKKLQMESPTVKTGQRMVNRDIYCGDCDHCPAGLEFMGLSADGNFLPCNFLQFSLGNIRDKSIRQMRDDLLKSEWFTGKPSCLCGEDDSFISAFIEPFKDVPKPLNAYEIFNLDGSGKNG